MLQPLQHLFFGTKVKMARDMQKRTPEPDYNCSMSKTAKKKTAIMRKVIKIFKSCNKGPIYKVYRYTNGQFWSIQKNGKIKKKDKIGHFVKAKQIIFEK